MIRTNLLLSAAGLFLMTAPVWGHHAFGGEFDPNKPVLLKGPVTKVEWVNPHAWIHVEVPKEDGAQSCQFTPNAKCEEWMVEGGTPNTLLRRGFTKTSLPVGTEIIADGYRAKDGSNRANGRDITFPDGRKIFLGGSSPDAPPEK